MITVFLFPVYTMLAFSALALVLTWFEPPQQRGQAIHRLFPWMFGALLAGILVYLAFIRGWPVNDVLLQAPELPGAMPFALKVVLLLMAGITLGLLQLILEANVLAWWGARSVSEVWTGETSWTLGSAVLVLFAATAEEIIWRGFLLSELHQTWQGWWIGAALVSSVAFGLHHFGLGWRHVFLKTGHGMIWSTSVLLTQSLWMAIIAHTSFNLALMFKTVTRPSSQGHAYCN